jgi:hypothetical protein
VQLLKSKAIIGIDRAIHFNFRNQIRGDRCLFKQFIVGMSIALHLSQSMKTAVRRVVESRKLLRLRDRLEAASPKKLRPIVLRHNNPKTDAEHSGQRHDYARIGNGKSISRGALRSAE